MNNNYIKQNDPNIQTEILKYKEFLISKINIDTENSKEKTYIDEILDENNILNLTNYQNFVQNLINPNTEYNRLLLLYATGVGKSITALAVAKNFMDIYKINKSINNKETGNIFIMGFTSEIFKKELLNNEYFGILNREEIKEFQRVKSMVNTNIESDLQHLKELKIRYNKRIKKKNIKFIGYKEFYNKLFITENQDNLNNYKDYEIINNIKLGNIRINKELLLSFKNSLIICDECHNLYNSLEQNNWGISIQIILDYYDNKEVDGYNSVRCLFLSATPITNNPVEIVSIVNLLSNKNGKIKKKDLFIKDELTDNGINIINKSIVGKISYLQYKNEEFYPSSEIIGDEIKDIPYLKFIKCPMSELHFETYKKLSNKQIKDNISNIDNISSSGIDMSSSIAMTEEFLISEEIKKESKFYPINLSLDNRYLLDYVIPNPESNKYGLYNPTEIKQLIQKSSKEWKNKHEINIIEKKSYGYYLNGGFLKKDKIKKYSTKYYKLLEQIKDIVINKSGKLFIYHNYVNNSGIFFIQEILKENGILDEYMNSVSNTLCSICYKKRIEHENNKLEHNFKPLRYVVISGEINNNIIDTSINKFNLSSNKEGYEFKIIIGSKAIKEGYDLKAIQNVIILHPPDNISTLIQILGRSIRNRSHIDLPKEKQKVNIYIYISTIPVLAKKYIHSFEELLYKKKVKTYRVIENIENIFYKQAIDYLINIDLNKNKKSLFNKTKENNKIIKNEFIDINKLKLDTFNAYYIDNEIKLVKHIIKRLFIEVTNIYFYNDLLSYVRSPPFKVNINTKLISEDSFIIALNELLYQDTNIDYLQSDLESVNIFVNSLYNNNDKIFIDLNMNKVTIIYINNLYILAKVNNKDDMIESSITDITIDENLYNKINIDIEDYYNHTTTNTNHNSINIDEYVKNNKILNNFEINKIEFINKYNYITSITDENNLIDELKKINIIYNYSIEFQIELIEYIIEYLFTIYTSKSYVQLNPNHNFYIIILAYYNIYNLIVFANNINLSNDIKQLYKDYIIKSIIINNKQNTSTIYNNYISSLILNSTEYLGNKKKKNIKVFDYLLPIGHLLNNKPIFYDPNLEQYVDDLYYKDNTIYVENSILICYQQINQSLVQFKLRPSNNKKISKDRRDIQTGIVCSFKDKSYLLDLCKKLNIDLTNVKLSKINLCQIIHDTILENELIERQKKSKIKWFYNIFEIL
jgi:superfamily II DNA or RNA helicase